MTIYDLYNHIDRPSSEILFGEIVLGIIIFTPDINDKIGFNNEDYGYRIYNKKHNRVLRLPAHLIPNLKLKLIEDD